MKVKEGAVPPVRAARPHKKQSLISNQKAWVRLPGKAGPEKKPDCEWAVGLQTCRGRMPTGCSGNKIWVQWSRCRECTWRN